MSGVSTPPPGSTPPLWTPPVPPPAPPTTPPPSLTTTTGTTPPLPEEPPEAAVDSSTSILTVGETLYQVKNLFIGGKKTELKDLTAAQRKSLETMLSNVTEHKSFPKDLKNYSLSLKPSGAEVTATKTLAAETGVATQKTLLTFTGPVAATYNTALTAFKNVAAGAERLSIALTRTTAPGETRLPFTATTTLPARFEPLGDPRHFANPLLPRSSTPPITTETEPPPLLTELTGTRPAIAPAAGALPPGTTTSSAAEAFESLLLTEPRIILPVPAEHLPPSHIESPPPVRAAPPATPAAAGAPPSEREALVESFRTELKEHPIVTSGSREEDASIITDEDLAAGAAELAEVRSALRQPDTAATLPPSTTESLPPLTFTATRIVPPHGDEDKSEHLFDNDAKLAAGVTREGNEALVRHEAGRRGKSGTPTDLETKRGKFEPFDHALAQEESDEDFKAGMITPDTTTAGSQRAALDRDVERMGLEEGGELPPGARRFGSVVAFPVPLTSPSVTSPSMASANASSLKSRFDKFIMSTGKMGARVASDLTSGLMGIVGFIAGTISVAIYIPAALFQVVVAVGSAAVGLVVGFLTWVGSGFKSKGFHAGFQASMKCFSILGGFVCILPTNLAAYLMNISIKTILPIDRKMDEKALKERTLREKLGLLAPLTDKEREIREALHKDYCDNWEKRGTAQGVYVYARYGNLPGGITTPYTDEVRRKQANPGQPLREET